MDKVKIDITGDATQFERAMTGVEARLKGLAGFGAAVKNSLAGLIGGGTIALLVNNMIQFGKSIQEAADRMGITIQRTQQWRVVARHMGRDLEFVESAMNKLNDAAVKGDKMHLFKALGLKTSEVIGPTALNQSDLLQRVVAGTKTMSHDTAETVLNQLTGKKTGGALLSRRDEIANLTNIKTVEDENIEKLAELGVEYENLIDVVRSALIPAFLALVKFIEGMVSKFQTASDVVERSHTVIDVARHKADLTGKLPPKWIEQVNMAAFKAQEVAGTGLVATGILGKEKFAADQDKRVKTLIEYLYGRKAAETGIAAIPQTEMEIGARRKDLEDRLQERRDALHKKELEKSGTVERSLIPTAVKQLIDSHLKTQNPMLRIGGLMGIDANYRLQRLAQRQVDLLSQIVKNTSPQDFGHNEEDAYQGYGSQGR